MSYRSKNIENIREGAFRFGGDIQLKHLEEQFYRDGVAYALCKSVIDDALGDAFNVTDPKTGDPLPWNVDLQKVLPFHWKTFRKGITYDYRDGKSLMAFLEKEEKELMLRVFPRKDYDGTIARDEFGSITYVKATSRIKGYTTGSKHHVFSEKEDKTDDLEVDELSKIYEVILRESEIVGEGISYLEPVWDLLIAIYFLVSHSAYRVARFGAGNKVVKQTQDERTPADPLSETDIDDLMEKLANFGSAHDSFWLPAGVELDLDQSGGTIDFLAMLDMYYALLSFYTGIPVSHLKGVIEGQLVGAEVDQESYNDVLRDIQNSVKPIIYWFVFQLNDFYNWDKTLEYERGVVPDFGIDFTVEKEISKSDQTKLDGEVADLAAKYIALGMKREAAFDKAGIVIDKKDLEDEVEEAEKLDKDGNPINPSANNDNKKKDGDDKKPKGSKDKS